LKEAKAKRKEKKEGEERKIKINPCSFSKP